MEEGAHKRGDLRKERKNNKEKKSTSSLKNRIKRWSEKTGEKTDLPSHFDDNIRVTAHHIPDGKIDTFFNMNSQQTQQVLHGKKKTLCEGMKWSKMDFQYRTSGSKGPVWVNQSGCSYL